MKKIHFLVIVFLGWMGSLGGQTIKVTPNKAKCFKDPGSITVNISGITSDKYPIIISVSRTGWSDDREIDFSPVINEEFKVSAPDAYSVRVVSKSDNQILFTPIRDIRVDAPLELAITHKTFIDCPDKGMIQMQSSGGTTPYTFSVINRVTGESEFKTPDETITKHEFPGLDLNGIYDIHLTDDNGCESIPHEGIVFNYTPMTVDYNITDVACKGDNNGLVNIIVHGGDAPPDDFVYYLNDGAEKLDNKYDGLSANTYTIGVMDYTCYASFPLVISEPDFPLTVSISTDNEITCIGNNDGKLTANAQNGWGGYTYEWKKDGSSFSNNTQQTISNVEVNAVYKVTVTDQNNCSAEASKTLTNPDPVTFTATGTNPLCAGFDGKITVSSTKYEESKMTYKLEKEDDETSTIVTVPDFVSSSVFETLKLKAGKYIITGKYTNGLIVCESDPVEVELEDPKPVVVNVNPSSPIDLKCFGDKINITLFGSGSTTGNYEYRIFKDDAWTAWQNGGNFTNLPSGTYKVQTREGPPSLNSCMSEEKEVVINQPVKLEIVETSIKTTKATCSGAKNGTITFTVIGGTGGYTYKLNDSPAISEGTPGQPKFTVLPSIDLHPSEPPYSIEVEDEKNCKATASALVELPNPKNFDVDDWYQYPRDPITCHTDEGKVKITVVFNSLDPAEDYLGGLEGFIRKRGETEWVQIGVFETSPVIQVEFPGLGEAGEEIVYETWLKYAKDKLPYGSVGCHIGNTKKDHIITIPAPIEFEVKVNKEITCNGGEDGEIELTITQDGYTGGGTRYRYGINSGTEWTEAGATWQNSPVFINLGQGDYVFNVKVVRGSEDICFADEPQSISLSSPSALNITSVVATGVNCPDPNPANGTIKVTTVGGATPLTYNIYKDGLPAAYRSQDDDGQFDNLPEGTYRVEVVDDAGCPGVPINETIHLTPITISRPAFINFTAVASVPVLPCATATTFITLNIISSDNGPFVYRLTKDGVQGNWSVSFNTNTTTIPDIGAGEYSVEIAYAGKQNSCADHNKRTVTVGVSDDYGISISGIGNACNGGTSVRIIVNSEPPLPEGSIIYTLYYKPDAATPYTGTVRTPNLTDGKWTFTGSFRAGSYYLTANVSGCLYTSNEIDLPDPDKIIIEVISSINPCEHQSNGEIQFKATGGVPGYTFELYTLGDGGMYETAALSNNHGKFDHLDQDVYYVRVVDSNTPSCNTPYYPATGTTLKYPGPLSATLTKTDILCDTGTGSATIAVTGGKTDYTYKWLKSDTGAESTWSSFSPELDAAGNTAIELPGGFYKVEVTDKCNVKLTSNDVQIKHSTLFIEIDEENTKGGINCDGTPAGQITVKVTGGTANASPGAKYIYVIKKDGVQFVPADKDVNIAYNPVNKTETYTVYGLGDGEYTIEVSDGKCSSKPSVTKTLKNPEPLTVTAKQTGAFCHDDISDGAITVTVIGGTPGYFVTIIDDKNQTIVQKTAIPPGESSFLIPMDGFAVGATKTYTVKVEDNKNCSVTKPVNLSRPKELKVTLKINGSQCVFPVILARTIDEGQGSVFTEWYLNGVEMVENKNKGSIETSIPGEYQVIVKDDHCIAESEKLTVVQYASLKADYKVHGVSTCPGDNTGSVEILNPTGGVSGSKYEFQVHYKDGDEIVQGFDFKEYTNNVITGLTAGEYYIMMRLQGVDGTCVPTLRIPEKTNEYITITANIQIEVVAVLLGCDNSGKTSIDFLVTWNDAKGNIIVKILYNGQEYWPQPIGLIDGKFKYRAELDTSGEAVITVYEMYDGIAGCPVNETVTVPESLSFSWEPEDKDCVNSTTVTLFFKGGTAPYELEFDGVRHSNIASNSFQVTAPLITNRTYPVKVSDNKCSVTGFIELAKPVDMDAITSASIIKDVSCDDAADGYIVIQPDTYKFLWEKDKSEGNELRNLNAGTYKVEISNLDGSCGVTHEITIDVANKLEVNIRGGDVYCPGADVMLFGEIKVDPPSNEIGRSVQWTLPDNEQVDWEPFKPVEFVAADASVTLTATINFSDASSCTSSKTFEVKLGDLPTLSPMDTMVYIPKGIALDLEVEAPNHTYYKWESSNPGMASLPQWPEPVSPVRLQSPNAPYILTLTLGNESGCETKQNFYVDFALDLFIPNVFTPNSPEPNNTWKFREIEKWTAIFDIQVNVFSRNGALVYSAKGYDNHSVVWDGRRNGENVPITNYYYIVKLVPKSSIKDTPARVITGWVMIMR